MSTPRRRMTAHERAAVAEGPTRGCGQPGHVGVRAYEGTAYCETCRAMAAEAEIERLTKLLDMGSLAWDDSQWIIDLPNDARSWRDALEGGAE